MSFDAMPVSKEKRRRDLNAHLLEVRRDAAILGVTAYFLMASTVAVYVGTDQSFFNGSIQISYGQGGGGSVSSSDKGGENRPPGQGGNPGQTHNGSTPPSGAPATTIPTSTPTVTTTPPSGGGGAGGGNGPAAPVTHRYIMRKAPNDPNSKFPHSQTWYLTDEPWTPEPTATNTPTH